MSDRKYCEFAPRLYLSDGIKHLSKIKWKLTHGAGQLTIYVICRAQGMEDRVTIMHCANLKQTWYKNHPVYVYGIAAGYEASRELLVKICDEAEQAGYGGRLGDYLTFATNRKKGAASPKTEEDTKDVRKGDLP